GLTADFARSSLSAQFDRKEGSSGDAVGGTTSVAAVNLRGVGPISPGGSFVMPLSGTFGDTPVTGNLDGAFFGPLAIEAGGVFSAGTAPDAVLVRDAFVAAQPSP